jgi:CBS domain-containing protein
VTGEEEAAVARIRSEGVAVGQIMSQPAVAVDAQETAWVALQRLTTSGLRHLVVVSGDRCVGVLSDRHVAAAWPFGELSRRTQLVLDLLGDTRPSVTVRTTAGEAARAMLGAGVDALPVVDADDGVVGLVTGSDLLSLLADAGRDSLPHARRRIWPRTDGRESRTRRR